MQSATPRSGSATELLAALGVRDVSPLGVTSQLGRFYYDVIEPAGIRYQTKRTGKSRLIILRKNDGSDANDGKLTAQL